MDIVVDTNVIRLYDAPADESFKDFFTWLKDKGSLAISQKLLNEYSGTGNRLLAALLNKLMQEGRHNPISNHALKAFKEDKHVKYTCNYSDIQHARLVFLSNRKKLVSFDNKLCADVNAFKKINGIQPAAERHPKKSFYE